MRHAVYVRVKVEEFDGTPPTNVVKKRHWPHARTQVGSYSLPEGKASHKLFHTVILLRHVNASLSLKRGQTLLVILLHCLSSSTVTLKNISEEPHPREGVAKMHVFFSSLTSSSFFFFFFWCGTQKREVKQNVQTALFRTVAEDDDSQASKRNIKTP